jgi:amidase
VRDFTGQDPDVDWAVEASITAMRRAGATAVDVRLPRWLLEAKGEFYNAVRYPEFTAQIAQYLKTLGPAYPKDIGQLLARAAEFNALRPDGAGPNPNRWTLFKREAESGGLDDYRYTSVRDHALPMVRATLANLTGFPDLIVPAGFSGDDLPVALSFLGPAFSEARLLALGYSFEQATHARRLPVHTPRLPGETIRVP